MTDRTFLIQQSEIRRVWKNQFETVCFTNGKYENAVVQKCTGLKMYVSKIQNNQYMANIVKLHKNKIIYQFS